MRRYVNFLVAAISLCGVSSRLTAIRITPLSILVDSSSLQPKHQQTRDKKSLYIHFFIIQVYTNGICRAFHQTREYGTRLFKDGFGCRTVVQMRQTFPKSASGLVGIPLKRGRLRRKVINLALLRRVRAWRTTLEARGMSVSAA